LVEGDGRGVRADHKLVAMSGLALAPEALEGIRSAQEDLERQAATLAAVGDPTAATATAMAAAAKAMHRLMVDVFLKTEKLIEEGRKPWTREEMRILINQLDETLLHRWAAFNRAGIAIGVLVALLFGGACTFGGWWMHSPPSELACADQTDGSHICWMYTRLPTPPATRK
jgi:hypothetical protein